MYHRAQLKQILKQEEFEDPTIFSFSSQNSRLCTAKKTHTATRGYEM